MKDIMKHRSLRNRVWAEPEFTNMEVDALIAGGANALTAPVLAARKMAPTSVASFLSPKLRDLLPNPSFFLDMDRAADRLVEAIVKGQSITIWSDYDVDGATSAATLGRLLRDCGHSDYDIYIPNRITEAMAQTPRACLPSRSVALIWSASWMLAPWPLNTECRR